MKKKNAKPKLYRKDYYYIIRTIVECSEREDKEDLLALIDARIQRINKEVMYMRRAYRKDAQLEFKEERDNICCEIYRILPDLKYISFDKLQEELQKRTKKEYPPMTLHMRLDQLEKAGLIEKRITREGNQPRKYFYMKTDGDPNYKEED